MFFEKRNILSYTVTIQCDLVKTNFFLLLRPDFFLLVDLREKNFRFRVMDEKLKKSSENDP